MFDLETSTNVTYKEAEAALLGSILMRGSLIEHTQSVVHGDDFEDLAHATIYQTMMDMYEAQKPIEFASVVTELRHAGKLQIVGGEAYLTGLAVYSAPTEWKYYASIITEAAGVRRVHDMARRALERAEPGSGLSYTDLLNLTQSDINDLAERATTKGDLTHVGTTVYDAIGKIEEAGLKKDAIIGVPSGLADFDHLTSGLLAGQMIVIAARPGFGKSTLGLDIARSAAIQHNIPTALFSLEMSSVEIMIRMLSAECRLDLSKLKVGDLSDSDWEKVRDRASRIATAPLMVDETANITMSEIKSKTRRMQATHGLGLIVIDYLQLVGSSRQLSSREQEVSAISRQAKLLAKELATPVVVMAQLNRGSESRAGGKPILSDLRESGAIEQDADVVVFIHREDKVDEQSSRAGEADLIVAKQRNGPTGTVPVGFQGHYSRFTNLSRQEEPPNFGDGFA